MANKCFSMNKIKQYRPMLNETHRLPPLPNTHNPLAWIFCTCLSYFQHSVTTDITYNWLSVAFSEGGFKFVRTKPLKHARVQAITAKQKFPHSLPKSHCLTRLACTPAAALRNSNVRLLWNATCLLKHVAREAHIDGHDQAAVRLPPPGSSGPIFFSWSMQCQLACPPNQSKTAGL